MTHFPDLALRRACTRFLSGHGPLEPRQWANRLAASPLIGEATDTYGVGDLMQRLEANVAALLGKPAALFFPKGVTAQQVALLVHAEATGHRIVALHPKSHIAQDESDTLDHLARLAARRLGPDHAPFTVADLDRAGDPLGVVSVELPLRRAGFLGTDWADLTAISHWCRGRRVPFHLDGARIWEIAPWYGRSLAEISALADTVYVSFYKGLGGLGGCVLAGDEAFIAACRPWRHRFGAELWTAFPFVVSALDGLAHHLPKMPAYHARAVALAAALSGRPGIIPAPAVPHGNSFRVLFQAPIAQLEARATTRARERGEWLVNGFQPTGVPGIAFAELVVGEATLGWTIEDAADAIAALA